MKDRGDSLILRAAKCALIGATLVCLTACYVEYDKQSGNVVKETVRHSQPALNLTVEQTTPVVAGKWSANLGSGRGEWVWVEVVMQDDGNPARSGTSVAPAVFPFFNVSSPWSGMSRMARDAGVLELKGSRSHDKADGSFTFVPDPEFVREANASLTVRPSVIDLFHLMIQDASRADLAAYAKAGAALNASDICELKAYRVDPGYFAKVRKGTDFSVHDVVRLRSYNVPETYPAEIRRTGWKFTLDAIISLYSYKVSSAEVVAWSRSGYQIGPGEITRLHSFGVSPDFGVAVRAALENATADDMIQLKSYGISEEYLKGVKATGAKFGARDLARLKSYNVSPGEIGAWLKSGYDLGVEDLVRLHSYNVAPNYAVALNNTNFNVGDLIKLKNYNVTADEVSQWLGAGYNLNAQDLVRLHTAGVPPEYGVALGQVSNKKLSVDAIIRFRQRGFTLEEIRQLKE